MKYILIAFCATSAINILVDAIFHQIGASTIHCETGIMMMTLCMIGAWFRGNVS